MISHAKNNNVFFNKWLKINLVLVFLIIIVGGLTRLTDSGLSITEWELLKGILPPINDLSWKKYFEVYQKIPQYEIVNPSMSLNEFKVIYFWSRFIISSYLFNWSLL